MGDDIKLASSQNVASGVTPAIGFTGHVNDADTGLVYMQQRYYDPVAGRFLSVDPVVTDTNSGRNFHRYEYANGSPYEFIDPDGRCPVEVDGVPCAVVIVRGTRVSDPHLVEGLNTIAAEINMPIKVYGGDRDPARNRAVHGATNSAHTTGNAADVIIPGKTKEETARIIFNSAARKRAGIREIYHRRGNGRLPEHTHVDTRTGPDLQQDPGGHYAPLDLFNPD